MILGLQMQLSIEIVQQPLTLQLSQRQALSEQTVYLTDDTLRTFLRKIRIAAGKDPNVFLGSHEVYSEIQGLYMPSVRIPNPYGESLVQVDVNGIQTFKGTGVGIHVDSIYGIPFIPSKRCTKQFSRLR